MQQYFNIYIVWKVLVDYGRKVHQQLENVLIRTLLAQCTVLEIMWQGAVVGAFVEWHVLYIKGYLRLVGRVVEIHINPYSKFNVPHIECMVNVIILIIWSWTGVLVIIS